MFLTECPTITWLAPTSADLAVDPFRFDFAVAFAETADVFAV
jgi:hypothetical protein